MRERERERRERERERGVSERERERERERGEKGGEEDRKNTMLICSRGTSDTDDHDIRASCVKRWFACVIAKCCRSCMCAQKDTNPSVLLVAFPSWSVGT